MREMRPAMVWYEIERWSDYYREWIPVFETDTLTEATYYLDFLAIECPESDYRIVERLLND